MKKPKILTILIAIYSFKWLKILLRYAEYLVFRSVSRLNKKPQTKPISQVSTETLPSFASATQQTGQQYQSEMGKLTVIRTYFVYILKSIKNKKFYIGVTDDLYQCYERHNTGKNPSTFDQFPFELVYYEPFINFFDAKNREKYLKTDAGNKFLQKHLHHYFASTRPVNSKRILKVVSFVSVQVLLILLPTLLILLNSPQGSQAAWFNDAWAFRQRIPIDTHSLSESNVYNEITVDTAALTTDKLQADCDDLRFTKENGQLLPYQIVSGCDSASTTIRVGFDTMPVAPFNIYMYYGNPSATVGSSTLTHSACSGGCAEGSFASEEKGPGPVAYWRFDEGYGSTANDSTTNRNTGTITGATWQPTDLCLDGKCLYLDETGDYITTGTSTTLALTRYTVSIRAKWSQVPTGTDNDFLFERGTGTTTVNYYLWLDANGSSCGATGIPTLIYGFRNSDDLAYSDHCYQYTPTSGVWNQYTVSYDGTNIKLYIDGQLVDSEAETDIPYTSSTQTLYLGSNRVGTELFNGFIDDAKVFNYARSSSQILSDYAGNSVAKGAATILGKASVSSLNDGLIGYWPMDEVAWTADCSTTSILDFSGNGANARSCPNSSGSTGGTSGKFGNSGNLDGAEDYVEITNPNLPTNDFTYSVWVNPTTISGTDPTIIMVPNTTGGNEVQIFLDSTANDLRLNMNGSFVGDTTNNSINTGTWTHIAITRSQEVINFYINGVLNATTTGRGETLDFSTCSFLIGTDADSCTGNFGNYFDGQIDEVRVYKRSLSAQEISQLYNWAPGPVGYWNFDENTGTSAFDKSGNNNTGVINSSISYKSGKFGSAIFIPPSPGNQEVNIAQSSSINNLQALSASAWVYAYSAGGSSIGRIVLKGDNSTNGWFLRTSSANSIRFQGYFNGGTNLIAETGSNTFSFNKWHHVAATWDGTTTASNVKIYIDGVQIPLSTSTNGVGTRDSDAAESLYIGNSNATHYWDGYIDDVKIYNYARSPQQVIEDMNGGHPTGGSPIGSQIIYSKLDEQNGTTINNSISTQNTISGTITGATWLTATSCKSNGCLYFDTTSDTLSFGDLSFTDSLTGFATSFWINPQSLTVDDSIVSKSDLTSTQNVFLIRTDSSNSDELRIYIGDNSDITDFFTTSNLDLTTSSWQHITVSYDGTESAAYRVKVYKNGRLVSGSVTNTIPTSLDASNTSNFRLGDSDVAGSDSLLMYLDEFKFYNAPLSQDSVLIDFNQGSAVNFGVGAPTPEPAQGSDGAGSPPVAYWTLNEGTGTTVNDISGNSNTSTTFTGQMMWKPAKYGSGLLFDGVDDVVRFTETSSTDLGDSSSSYSIGAWFKTGANLSSAGDIVAKWNGIVSSVTYPFELFMNSSEQVCFELYDGSTFATACSTDSYNDNLWHFAMGVRDKTNNLVNIYVDGILVDSITDTTSSTMTNNANLTIGNGSNSTYNLRDFSGSIDEVKIYNYARTQAQVAYDYNRGEPIGWWKFDECQGDTFYDASGFGNNGTWSGSGGSQTSVGTCSTSSTAWGNGVTGKFNSSLQFDSSDDTVNIGNISGYSFERTQPFSVSAWIKTPSIGSYSIITKQDNNSPYSGWNLQTGLVNGTYFQLVNTYGSNFIEVNSGPQRYADNQWHMITATYDGSSTGTGVTLYFDGNLDPATIGSGSINATSVNSIPVHIGSRNGASQFMNGQIDDARIYNYVLSATHVKKLYNDGASVFFGPTTGSP